MIKRVIQIVIYLQLAGLMTGAAFSSETVLADRIDAGLLKAAHFLVAAQSADGAWRSDTYGCFREVPVLTPYVMSTLYFLEQGGAEGRDAFRRGVAFLIEMIDDDGLIRTGPRGFNFPLYTATMASRVVVLDEKTEIGLRAQKIWLAAARSRQLTEELGWSRSDPEYGGWGFSLGLPRKPEPGAPRGAFVESNLSATLFGIAALRSARVPLDDPSWKGALTFVKRCQNYSDDGKGLTVFDDGGFYFIPDDPLQNKAGVAGVDRFGRTRFSSYGSMTADGLRALLQCGLRPGHPRVDAAREWLEGNFSVTSHPGRFDGEREILRGATYYYYLWSLSHAFARLGLTGVRKGDRTLRWAELMAEELLKRQEPDGSWINVYTDAKEDDPLVATPWAAAALEVSRRVIARDS